MSGGADRRRSLGAATYRDADEGWELPLLRSERDPGAVRARVLDPRGRRQRAAVRHAEPRGQVGRRRRRGRREPAPLRCAPSASAAPLYVARQVHGATVVARAGGRRSGGDRARSRRTRSAPTSRASRSACSSPTASRSLFADPRTGAVAAAHAGWRGTVAGVLPAAVRALVGARRAARPICASRSGPRSVPAASRSGAEVVAAFGARALGVGRSGRRRAASPTNGTSISRPRTVSCSSARASIPTRSTPAPSARPATGRASTPSVATDSATGQMMGVIAGRLMGTRPRL